MCRRRDTRRIEALDLILHMFIVTQFTHPVPLIVAPVRSESEAATMDI